MARAHTPPLPWPGCALGGALTNDVAFVRKAVLIVFVMATNALGVGMTSLLFPEGMSATSPPKLKFSLTHPAARALEDCAPTRPAPTSSKTPTVPGRSKRAELRAPIRN